MKIKIILEDFDFENTVTFKFGTKDRVVGVLTNFLRANYLIGKDDYLQLVKGGEDNQTITQTQSDFDYGLDSVYGTDSVYDDPIYDYVKDDLAVYMDFTDANKR